MVKMMKTIKLKYCPRVKQDCKWPLIKPIPHCKWRGRQWTGISDENICCYWTKKGLIKYCKENNIKIELSLQCECVLEMKK